MLYVDIYIYNNALNLNKCVCANLYHEIYTYRDMYMYMSVCVCAPMTIMYVVHKVSKCTNFSKRNPGKSPVQDPEDPV